MPVKITIPPDSAGRTWKASRTKDGEPIEIHCVNGRQLLTDPEQRLPA